MAGIITRLPDSVIVALFSEEPPSFDAAALEARQEHFARAEEILDGSRFGKAELDAFNACIHNAVVASHRAGVSLDRPYFSELLSTASLRYNEERSVLITTIVRATERCLNQATAEFLQAHDDAPITKEFSQIPGAHADEPDAQVA